jgi:hypothetical protein
MALEQDPRVTEGPTFFSSLKDWMKRATVEVTRFASFLTAWTWQVSSSYTAVSVDGKDGSASLNLGCGPAPDESNTITGWRQGKPRWRINMPGTGPESGANYGGAFSIDRFSDAGGFLGTPFAIDRRTGAITTGDNPGFVYNFGNAAAPGTDIVFSGPLFNRQNHYNAANGRFTAPVTGLYFFSFHQLADNATAGEYRIAFYANGVGFGGNRTIQTKPASVWQSLRICAHIYLIAGDYVTVRYETGPANLYGDGGYNQFSGNLIG